MTSFELGEELGLKESYIRSHWQDIVKNYAKKDVILVKVGRGPSARYGIKQPWEREVRWID